MQNKASAAQVRHCFAICAYGASPYLETCIRSVLSQSAKMPSAVIVCTSTPNEKIERLCTKYDLPLYVRAGKSGLKDDWNFAVQMAAEKTAAAYVTIAHQDDRYHPAYTAQLFRAIQKYKNQLLVFCSHYRTIDANGNEIPGKAEHIKRILRIPLHIWPLNTTCFGKRLALRFGNSIGCPTCTYRIAECGLPLFQNDYAFVIDWDTLWHLAAKKGRIVCDEHALLDYRIHGGAATKTNIKNHNREREETELFCRMWPLPIVRILMHFYKKAYTAYDE